MYITIGLFLAALIMLFSAVVTLIGGVKIFKRFVETGRTHNGNDFDFVSVMQNDKFSYHQRDRSIAVLLSGLMIDFTASLITILLWPVAIPTMIVILTAAILRTRKAAKDEFIGALKGTR